MEMTKLKVSGYFRTQSGTDTNSEVFDDMAIKVPHRNEEFFKRDAMRLFPVYKKLSKKYKDMRYEGLIKLDVDDMEDIEGKPLCVGKDVKQMDWDELQSMACYFNIRQMKLYKSCSLREAREDAYVLYQEKVMKRKVFRNEVGLLRWKEAERARGQRLDLDDYEVSQRISEVESKAFNMITTPDDPKNSYNFSKQPPLVIEDKDEQTDPA